MLLNSIKDQSLSFEVEEWLKHNKATVIPPGVSTATGYTLPGPSERTQQESKKRIREINQIVKAEKEAKKAMARASYQAQKALADQQTKREAIEIMKIFREKANHGDLGRLAGILGVARKTLSNWACGAGLPDQRKLEKLKIEVARFEFKERVPQKEMRKIKDREKRSKNPETIRRRELSRLKNEAIELGLTHFTGPCAKHGMTEYKIINKNVRCRECEKEKQKRKYEKMPENLKKMKYCLKYGKKSFIGTCETHGEVQFYINRSGHSHVYRCDLCRKESYKKAREKKPLTDAQRYRKLNREMALAMYEADPTNRAFKGMCVKHGETDFYIKIEKRLASGISYACKACTKC